MLLLGHLTDWTWCTNSTAMLKRPGSARFGARQLEALAETTIDCMYYYLPRHALTHSYNNNNSRVIIIIIITCFISTPVDILF